MLLSWSDAVHERPSEHPRASYEVCRCKARERVIDWTSYFQFFAGGSSLIATSTGFVGIASRSIKLGDEVVLPFASSAPIVARRVDGAYQFEGLAFAWRVGGRADASIPSKIRVRNTIPTSLRRLLEAILLLFDNEQKLFETEFVVVSYWQ